MTLSGTFFLYGLVAAMAVVFGLTMLPETRGKTLEQINMMFIRERLVRCGPCNTTEADKEVNNNNTEDGENKAVLLTKT